MITCSVCGHLNDSSNAVCENCGSDLSDSPDWDVLTMTSLTRTISTSTMPMNWAMLILTFMNDGYTITMGVLNNITIDINV